MSITGVPTTEPLPSYDWKLPALMQDHDWDCAEESCHWMLKAWGRATDEAWIEQSLLDAGVVNPAYGLMDASGAGLAAWLNQEYGAFGYVASNVAQASFDDVAREAGGHNHPLQIGGRAWYHWSGVRGYDQTNDRLLLANPAPGWHGVYQTMSRAQWSALGSWSLVRLTHPMAENASTSVGHPKGPDVSSHQGAVDWAAARAAGAAYAFTKATGGAWYTNPTLAENWAGMKAAGLKRGAYHYAFEPSGQPFPGPGAAAEADYFLSRMLPLGLGPGDMLVLDAEEGQGNVSQWTLDWLRCVEELTGIVPLLYTGRWFSDAHGFPGQPALGAFPLWLADYAAQPPSPPQPWTKVAFWQYTAQGSCPGIVGPCDLNLFDGTTADLANYGMASAPPVPTDPPYSGIGSGLLEMMAADGTEPAQRTSTWLPLGVSPSDVEECYGKNGTRYTWLLMTNSGIRDRAD